MKKVWLVLTGMIFFLFTGCLSQKSNLNFDYTERAALGTPENSVIFIGFYATNNATFNGLLFDTNGRYSIEDIFTGHWPDGLISDSGIIVRDRLLGAKGTKKPEVVDEPDEPDQPDNQDEPDLPDPEE